MRQLSLLSINFPNIKYIINKLQINVNKSNLFYYFSVVISNFILFQDSKVDPE